MMVFEKTPNLCKGCEIPDLDVRESRETDAGPAVELVIGVKDGRNPICSLSHRLAMPWQRNFLAIAPASR
jgi:hypothetical protein